MYLTAELIPAWVRWLQPDGNKTDWDTAAQELLQKSKDQPETLKQRLIALDSDGQIQASLFISAFQPGVLTFSAPRCRRDESDEVAAEVLRDLIREAVAYARTENARLQCRLPQTAQLSLALAELPALGAQLSHTRVEFMALVSDLPAETGSPLSWQSLQPVGPYTLEQAAEILTAAGQGDPDWDPEDDALELLKSYLSDEALSTAPECVQIAALEGQVAGIVVAQINLLNGWSRITYMGLLPAFRGRGLGKWLHRHGFTMMRNQGGREYHGGTVQGNQAMEALFYSQGCRLTNTLQEWHWD